MLDQWPAGEGALRPSSAPGDEGAPDKRARRIIVYCLLVLAGVLGNLFPITVFYRVDLLLGSMATLLAVRLYGPAWGVLCALAAGAPTLFLWQHPYALVIFTSEAAFVGLLLRRNKGPLLLIDGIYWLVLGMPLVWLFYGGVMDVDATGVNLIALKQSINGVINALGAALLSNLPGFRRWARWRYERVAISLYERLFNLLVALVLVPSLVVMVLVARERLAQLETDAAADMRAVALGVVSRLSGWYQGRHHAVRTLAEHAEQHIWDPEQIQRETETLVDALPDFHNMYVADSEGRTIAFHPKVNARGESTIGLSFADRPYFKELKETLRPVVSRVFMGRGGVFSPIVTLSHPIILDQRFAGYALGALDLGHLSDMLLPYSHHGGLRVTLLDADGIVIASTSPGLRPLQQITDRKSSVLRSVDEDTWLWTPEPESAPTMLRWQSSLFVQDHLVSPGLSWRVLIEEPLEPVASIMYRDFARYLATVWALSLLALVVARLVSTRLARPIRQLAELTTDLPERLLRGRPLAWPTTTTEELETLVANFMMMSGALEQHVRAMRDQSGMLERTNDELRLEMAERKRLEGQMRQAQKMQAVGTLAGGIAHDFNNLLAAILGYTSLALKEVDSASSLGSKLLEVQRAGQRGRELVQQILTFSRQRENPRVPVRVAGLLRETTRLLRPTLPTTVQIHERIGAPDATVMADPSQLQQVVMNLSANAEHAMRGVGGTLEIALDALQLTAPLDGYPRAVPLGSWVRVRVTDTGIGMERSVIDRMFEPFYTTKPVGEGTGMGLAVVHGTVEASGGIVTVESEVGRGTSVSVFLPAAAEPERVAELPLELAARGTERVLFVDDETALVLLGREMLQWLGYRVDAFESSRRAMDAFRAAPESYDVIVTDQTMPELSGDALAREARRVRSDIPVILCTGFSPTLTPERAVELGIDAYLYKPIVAEELGAAIREVLARRSAHLPAAPAT